MSLSSIFLKWKRYQQECIHEEATDEQITEAKKAFYAGCRIAMTMMAEAAQHNIATNKYRFQLEEWASELAEYQENVLKEIE